MTLHGKEDLGIGRLEKNIKKIKVPPEIPEVFSVFLLLALRKTDNGFIVLYKNKTFYPVEQLYKYIV